MFDKILKVFKPPYTLHDLPALLGVFLLFLIIPVLSFNVDKVKEGKAKAIVAPNATSCPTLPGAGDVDQDGDVDQIDSLKISRYVSGLDTLTSDQLKRANVNDDVTVNSNDSLLITRFVAEIDKYLPACIDHDKDGYSDNAEIYIGTDPYDSCPDSLTDKAWPSDFDNNGIVEQKDFDSYTTPVRHMNTSPGQAGFDVRWDVVPGSFGFSNYINSTDISKITIITNKLGSVCSQGTKPTISPSTINSDIYAGDNISFSWKANSANPPCDASGDWSGQKEVSGTYSPTKATQIKTYSFILKCYGTEGWTQASYSFNAKNPSPDKINNAKLYSTGSTVYVIQDNKKRWVESPAVMDKCRYDWGAIISGPAVDVYLPYVPTNSDSVGINDVCPPVERSALMACEGKMTISIDGSNKEPGDTYDTKSNATFGVRSGGLSRCVPTDKVVLMSWNFGNNSWNNTGKYCTLSRESSSCVIAVSFPKGYYAIKLSLDKNGDSSEDNFTGYIYINVTVEDCNGKYYIEGSGGGNRYKTPYLDTTGNFGDPDCNYSTTQLYNILWSMDPSWHTDYFFNTVISCESGYNPNAYNPDAKDPAGAWGLFQMGRGKNGQYDHGDVPWDQQAKNAVIYHILLGHGWGYWQCA